MSASRRRVPKYRHYKPKDLAVVRIDGRDFYLGPYDSPQSWEKYHRLLAERLANPTGKSLDQGRRLGQGLAIKDLMLAYLRFAATYYVKNGQPTDECYCIRAALRPLRQLYGDTPVSDFGPLALKSVRSALVANDNCRGVVNHHVSRIRRMFKWGVENELVHVEVYQALMTVAGFRKNRSPARETIPVGPLSADEIEAPRRFLSPVLNAMIDFQRLTGCRPGEVCILRPCDLDRSRPTWCYRPESHKTEHHDRQRRIFVGPAAQAALMAWLNRGPNEFCFNPRESAQYERERSGEAKSQKQKAKQPRISRRGTRYTTDSYRRAIERACRKADCASWSPNQLRHTRGTELRSRFGLEAAQTVLGHDKADITQIYAERDFELAERVMLEVG
jgi:integrase